MHPGPLAGVPGISSRFPHWACQFAHFYVHWKASFEKNLFFSALASKLNTGLINKR